MTPDKSGFIPWEIAHQRLFNTFLAATDEKSIILKRVLQDVDTFQPKSMLDIGAGNGAIALPLSRRVATYTAVEANGAYVKTLRKAGVDVIEGFFPFPLPRKYDYVLASHCVSFVPWLMEEMVDGAWDAVEERGRLTVVTMDRRGGSDWKKLMDTVGLQFGLRNPDGFERLTMLLRRFGSLSVENLTTHVRTKTAQQMVDALSFVGSNGIAEPYCNFMYKAESVREILDSNYQTPDGYQFPFEHLFLRVEKNSAPSKGQNYRN